MKGVRSVFKGFRLMSKFMKPILRALSKSKF